MSGKLLNTLGNCNEFRGTREYLENYSSAESGRDPAKRRAMKIGADNTNDRRDPSLGGIFLILSWCFTRIRLFVLVAESPLNKSKVARVCLLSRGLRQPKHADIQLEDETRT